MISFSQHYLLLFLPPLFHQILSFSKRFPSHGNAPLFFSHSTYISTFGNNLLIAFCRLSTHNADSEETLLTIMNTHHIQFRMHFTTIVVGLTILSIENLICIINNLAYQRWQIANQISKFKVRIASIFR